MKHIQTFESFLNEKFGDDHPKNTYVELDSNVTSKYADDIVNLTNIAYDDKGGLNRFRKLVCLC